MNTVFKAEDSAISKNNSDKLPVVNWGSSQEELRELRGGTGTGVKDATPWRK